MLTINDLADRLGLSAPQTRRLLRSVESVVQAGVTRGRSNQIRISTDVVGTLIRASSLWLVSGLTFDDLPEVLQAELDDEKPVLAGAEPSSNGHQGELSEGWRSYVDHLESELERRDEMIVWLRGRVEALEVKALPSGRPWWQRVLGIGHAAQASKR